MIYGVSTWRAHLDALDGIAAPGEINWMAIYDWMAQTNPDDSRATFCGRYFLGNATAAEAAAGSGFCRWVHGAGADPLSPISIVPIQRADPARQSPADDDEAIMFGHADATALARELDLCLAVGDLGIYDPMQILVFLEVADGTPLSPAYWAAWATTIHAATLQHVRLKERTGAETVQPLLPAILCAFPWDDWTESFLPDAGVMQCLETRAPRGFRANCAGFWARRHETAYGPQGVPFDATRIVAYHQPVGIFDIRKRVPLRYTRCFDRFDAPPIPGAPAVPESGEARDALALVTLDLPASGEDDPLPYTFGTTMWRADATDAASGPLTELPVQLGIDTARSLTRAAGTIACVGRKQLAATRAPYHKVAPHTPVALRGPCEFVMRYYAPSLSSKVMRQGEATAISWAGMGVAAVWEQNATITQGWAPYVRALIRPFVDGHGRADGAAAFAYAADVIDQPPYTPVYFAVDFPIDIDYAPAGHEAEAVRTPPLDTIVAYFRDLQRGYHDYLAAHPDQPYFIDVYGQVEVSKALYRAGLATHFWQTPWATWGNSKRPFRHLNMWQIALSSVTEMADDNAALKGCATPGSPNEKIWFDLNVAWGDPGTFQVFL